MASLLYTEYAYKFFCEGGGGGGTEMVVISGSVSVGLVTNRGLVEQVPSHFTSFPSGRRNTINLVKSFPRSFSFI